MKIFLQAEIWFFLLRNTNALLHLFAKFKRGPSRLHHHGFRSWKTFRLEQAHGFVPRCSAHPLGTGCDRFCSALCRSSRCDALPGGSRLLSVPRIPVLIHTLPNRNEALCLGLTHMLKRHPDLSGCLFALGDQPLLRPRTLERICRRYLECKISPGHSESVFPDSDFSILKSKLPQNSGIAEKSPIVQLCSIQMTASPEPSVSTTVGSPILFDRAYFDELLHLPEKAGGSHVLRQHPDVVQYVTAEVWRN